MFVQLKKRILALLILVQIMWYTLWAEDPYDDYYYNDEIEDSDLYLLWMKFLSALVPERYMIALNQVIDDFKDSKMADPEYAQAVQDNEPEYMWERVKLLVSDGTPPEDAVKVVYGGADDGEASLHPCQLVAMYLEDQMDFKDAVHRAFDLDRDGKYIGPVVIKEGTNG